MMYVSTTEHVKMSAIFRTQVVQFGQSITYTEQKAKNKLLPKVYVLIRTFYKKIIERINISPTFAHRANLKFAYFEQ
jgi:hypothetical protein